MLIVFATKKCARTFKAIRKLSTLSGNFLGYPEIFRIIQKISSLSGNFPGYPKTFQTIQKIFRLSGNFPGYPETFLTIRKIFRLSGNFADGPQTSQYIFKGYAQKLSERTKTFRMAMQRCHDGFWASAMDIGPWTAGMSNKCVRLDIIWSGNQQNEKTTLNPKLLSKIGLACLSSLHVASRCPSPGFSR